MVTSCLFPYTTLFRSVILLLVAAEILYLLLAKKFDFFEVKDDDVGADTRRPLKGAGIVFWIAAVLFVLFNPTDRKSTRLNSSHVRISYSAVCAKEEPL